MLSREDLYHSIMILVPDAKFSYWPDDNRELEWQDDSVDYIKLDGWCVCWLKVNSQKCPDLASIQAITKQQITADIAKREKDFQVDHFSQDLRMIASFDAEKKTNPALSFGDYIDQLKVKQQAVLADIAASKQPV